MKSAYEIVAVEELQAGDVFKFDVGDPPDEHEAVVSVERIPGRNATQIGFTSDTEGFQYRNGIKFLRQLPMNRQPDVLEMALEIATNEANAFDKWSDSPGRTPEKYIQRAIRELESEAGNAG